MLGASENLQILMNLVHFGFDPLVLTSFRLCTALSSLNAKDCILLRIIIVTTLIIRGFFTLTIRTLLKICQLNFKIVMVVVLDRR